MNTSSNNNIVVLPAPRPLSTKELRVLLSTYKSIRVVVNTEGKVGIRFDTRKGKFCWVYDNDLAVKDVDKLVSMVNTMSIEYAGKLHLQDARVLPDSDMPAPVQEEAPTEELTFTCAGTTKKGEPCKNVVPNGGDYCHLHAPVEEVAPGILASPIKEPEFSTIEPEAEVTEHQFVPAPKDLSTKLRNLTAARNAA